MENFKKEMCVLLDEGKYDDAKLRINEVLSTSNKEDQNFEYLLAEVAGFLIDIGSESLDREAAEAGICILYEQETNFKKNLSEQSFNYCLGNGLHALYKIESNKVGLPTLELIKPHLSEAKNYYFKAFKEINLERIDHIDLEILTNLATNLKQSGRIGEALRLYKSVLQNNSKFPQALIGFAEGLDYWMRISFGPQTLALYSLIYKSYTQGLLVGILPPKQKIYCETKKVFYEKILKKKHFDFDTIETELLISKKEYEQHSDYIKFCIDNFLMLNEHSLFCNCSEASSDNLSVVQQGLSLYGEKVGKMELLLNRLKSEFNLAKKLYYKGLFEKNNEEEVRFSDLMDAEAIGEAIEGIRTSLRLCFGLLDKIANGLCYFYDLPKKVNEKIYFESFWKNKNCPERWEKLKSMRNPHVVALYSIANDFNSNQGEFHFYKQWRNSLEHNNLILVEDDNKLDLLNLFDDDFVIKIPITFFKEQALHLLQICCSAIYSYTYVVRTESLHKGDNNPTIPFIIQSKNKYL